MDLSIELITVPVRDIDTAKAFYVEQLGFMVESDRQIDAGHRHVILAPPGSVCRIALQYGYVDATPGSLQGTQMVVTDIAAAHQKLSANGVAVSGIDSYPWGEFIHFSDPDGNGWSVQQPPDA